MKRRRSCLGEMNTPAIQTPMLSGRHGCRRLIAAVTTGSASSTSRDRRTTSCSSNRATAWGEPASASRSGRRVAPRPQRRSTSTRRSTSSDAGRPRNEEATPGRKRIPTTVLPGARDATVGPRWGPETAMTSLSTAYEISTQPFGTVRCSYAGPAAPTCWIHTLETWPAICGTGMRSR